MLVTFVYDIQRRLNVSEVHRILLIETYFWNDEERSPTILWKSGIQFSYFILPDLCFQLNICIMIINMVQMIIKDDQSTKNTYIL